MADSLKLRGYAGVSEQSGTELALQGDDGRKASVFKEFDRVSLPTYLKGTKFVATQSGNSVILVLDTNPDTRVDIDLAASFVFTFSNHHSIKEAALLTAAGGLIERYEFGKTPGVGTRVINGPATRP